MSFFPPTGIQEGTQCTKCKNNWALKFSIILLYIVCAFLTITVTILGCKGMYYISNNSYLLAMIRRKKLNGRDVLIRCEITEHAILMSLSVSELLFSIILKMTP